MHLTDFQRKGILSALDSGSELQDIANNHNVSVTELERALYQKEETIVVRPTPKKQTVSINKQPEKKLKTKSVKAIDQLIDKHMSDSAIANKLGLHRTSVYRYRKKHNLESGKTKPDYSKQISKLYAKGFNDRQISDKLGIHINTVYLWRKRNKKGAHTIR